MSEKIKRTKSTRDSNRESTRDSNKEPNRDSTRNSNKDSTRNSTKDSTREATKTKSMPIIQLESSDSNNDSKNKVVFIETIGQYNSLRDRGLVIVDFNTSWCNPCKKFAPVFEELANKYPDVVFLSVDAEKIEHEDCENISSVPTFKIFYNGVMKREFSGIDRDRIEKYLERYAIQIYYNGHVKRVFTLEDREKINKYMMMYASENIDNEDK